MRNTIWSLAFVFLALSPFSGAEAERLGASMSPLSDSFLDAYEAPTGQVLLIYGKTYPPHLVWLTDSGPQLLTQPPEGGFSIDQDTSLAAFTFYDPRGENGLGTVIFDYSGGLGYITTGSSARDRGMVPVLHRLDDQSLAKILVKLQGDAHAALREGEPKLVELKAGQYLVAGNPHSQPTQTPLDVILNGGECAEALESPVR